MEQFRIGFVGMGNMAKAVLACMLDKKLLPAEKMAAFDPHPAARDFCLQRSVRFCADNRELAETSDLLFLFVKPQNAHQALTQLAPGMDGKCLVSFAAGLTLPSIAAIVPNAHLLRVMPNTPMMIGLGASALQTPEDSLPKSYVDFTRRVLNASGIYRELPEQAMNAVIGVSASSPAFFYRILHTMAQAAQAQGIDYGTALELAAKAMEGSARMVMDSGETPGRLIDMVAARGGTTFAMLQSLDQSGLDQSIANAMLACTERAQELTV